MSKFGLMLTMPHAGTHRLMSFLGSLYNQVERVGVGETGNAIIRAYLSGKISKDAFISFTKWLRIKYPDPPYILRDVMEAVINKNEVCECAHMYNQKYKWLFYYSHFVPPGYDSKKWPQDLIDEKGMNLPVVTPLRDPILTSVSIMLLTGDKGVDYDNFQAPDFKGISPYIWWTIDGFKKLVEYKKKLTEIYFLPVDLYNNLYIEDRLIRATKLIRSMELDPNDEWETQVRIWERCNPSKHNPEDLFNNRGELMKYKLMKQELECGHGLPVKNDLIDYLIGVYKGVDGLQELFEAEGYRQLSWFK